MQYYFMILILFLPTLLNGMSSSSSSTQTNKALDLLQSLENHPFNNLPCIFTLTDEFNEQKQKAYQRIAFLIALHIKHDNAVFSVAFSPDGNYLATGCADRHARIINIKSGKIVYAFKHDRWVLSVAFSPDGNYLATGCADRSARIINIKSGKIVHAFKHGRWVRSVAFSPDSNYLATGDYANRVRIIDIKSGRIMHRFKRNDGIRSVSPDWHLLATGYDDGSVRIFDFKSGEIVHSFKHGLCVHSVAFSPDGNSLATECCDGFARIMMPNKTREITGTLSLAQYNLIEALSLAARDTKKLRKNQRARIHANDEHWKIWLSLKKLLPQNAIKRLEPYIIDSTIDGYETPEEDEKSSCNVM